MRALSPAPPIDPSARLPATAWMLLCVAIVALGSTMQDALTLMWGWFIDVPEYSHGLAIPLITAFLVWQRRDELERLPFHGAWLGLALTLLGVVIAVIGRLGTIFTIEQLALIVVLLGLVLSLTGREVFRRLRVPLLLLLFMVPLPQFLQQNLSSQMQLLSSRIGVGVIRLFGISVYLEGNVIDLGVYKLQVAEACDGLRYLFPLMTLGFIASYLFQAAFWKRALLFLSTIPLAILMNSFRVGVIGVTVEHWGVAMAEGFLHAFQGWLVFMVTCALLMLEMILLARVGRDRRPWREVFGFAAPVRSPSATPGATTVRPLPKSFLLSIAIVLTASALGWLTPRPQELHVTRADFINFPQQLSGWRGQRQPLEAIYQDVLKLDDYYLGDFTRVGESPVNFYVAWYNSQQGGRSAHSPRTCLPGGGWQIQSLTQVFLPEVRIGHQRLRVNRALIRLGSQQQLVYYWFQQRGRVVTNEYAVKWYLFWDSLTRHRTDGALVRLVAAVPQGAIVAADGRLTAFAAALAPLLPSFVPN